MLYQKTQQQLLLIEHELKRIGCWSDTEPSPQALMSTMPFACDLMPLEQWLQFIFIPKMQQLIIAKQPLPNKISIAPMAEHVWSSAMDKALLIKQINELDILLNE